MSTPSPPASANSTQPTRIALFKFLPSTTSSQKHDRATAFLALYSQHEDLIVSPPRGGKPLNTPLELTNVSRVDGWDFGFVVRFRSEAARKEFDSDPGHDELKTSCWRK
ncbi:hypothetical protein BU24DRAFT_487290 [Aaosphaeria arxii CBS 175.79]|uniref:Stress-response A/B barrel domain-containing protein n=1 Tax=Aaosphaeria arxii CBS 175.79 TaxID=1450172 RepID=A0A6A5Y595_9PLEO|nr:uncharacterized protein BU24DRAFT_487290 [Aaosphaeria arxii CBS 175.79]KAF2020732.1 hypothetical protein BU24DRAFT_487290 [Aaosphaeria arxii CBS 175.79]